MYLIHDETEHTIETYKTKNELLQDLKSKIDMNCSYPLESLEDIAIYKLEKELELQLSLEPTITLT